MAIKIRINLSDGGFSDLWVPLAEESCPRHYKGDHPCLNLIMLKEGLPIS